MISMFAGLLLLGMAPAPPAPPPPPQPAEMSQVRARANLGRLISNDDYPAEALRKGEQGTVGFRLAVGVDGRVAGCTITSSSGSAALDSTTCRLMTERARFSPARDVKGQPVTDSVAARIVWRIMKSSQLPPDAASSFVETIRASSTEGVTCSLAVNDQPPQATSCPRDVAAQMLFQVRMERSTPEQTIVTTFTPAGDAEPSVRGNYGSLFLDSEAVLGIAADGTVLECRVVRNEVRGLARGQFKPPSPCEGYAPGRRAFQPAVDAGAPRTLTIRIRGYYRG